MQQGKMFKTFVNIMYGKLLMSEIMPVDIIVHLDRNRTGRAHPEEDTARNGQGQGGLELHLHYLNFLMRM